MQRPAKSKKPRKGRAPGPPAPMSLREKLQIWAWIVGILAIVLTFGIGAMKSKTARHLDQTINRWRKDYHLTPDQAERVRTIERRFHGSGNPFTLPTHSAEEVRVHHEEVAAAMNPADGERFLKTQDRGKKHR